MNHLKVINYGNHLYLFFSNHELWSEKFRSLQNIIISPNGEHFENLIDDKRETTT